MATLSDKEAFEVAYEEAKKGFEEGGVPVRIVGTKCRHFPSFFSLTH